MPKISKHDVSSKTIRARQTRLGVALLLLGSAACLGIAPALADVPPKPGLNAKQDPQVKQLMN